MITTQELDTLDWYKDNDGYGNGDDFEIARVKGAYSKSNWGLYYSCEVNGRGELVKELKDFEDLKETYFLVSGHELEIKSTE